MSRRKKTQSSVEIYYNSDENHQKFTKRKRSTGQMYFFYLKKSVMMNRLTKMKWSEKKRHLHTRAAKR